MSQSLLVADPQLADTEAALAEWRKTLHCLSHIPEDLWSRATELAERHGLAKVTVALKLDTTRLKRWLRGTDKTSTEGGRASPPSPALVEFNFVLPLAQSPCVLVLSDRYGRTLRIELPRLASSDRFPCPRSFATAVARSPPTISTGHFLLVNFVGRGCLRQVLNANPFGIGLSGFVLV
ncbi:MAG: hypothetical protein J0L95_03550 [Candidatus Accumulibacter sp.]|jgi:hypothetical protein|uniref:hypothetical protein n=1 Tax=Accumulibacter sp. TaxID=2053492 RepID=UPI001AC9E6FB|nr:hypothetical protein [Accumulibacter sp.]MBN8437108.1 hypothetical protein [Accumulibacter sp.]